MLKFIDNFLNKTTMYKVMLYGLSLIVIQGIILSALQVLPFDLIWLCLSLTVFVVSCYGCNKLISKLLNIPTNIESAYITSLILFLIIQPASRPLDLLAIFLISAFAMISKYILVINRIHIFNPAAFGALLGAVILNYYATWWAGSTAMLPIVFIVGFLIVKKIRRFEMVVSFLLASVITICLFNYDQNINYIKFLYQILTSWPIIFFASIMLVEPLTMPGVKRLQILYAIFVGFLFGTRFNMGPIYSTPELALILGNLVFFVVKPRSKFILYLKEKLVLSPNIYEFIFSTDKKPNFEPGQFLEWTFPHKHADSRGNRRFFTVASSPTESDVKIAIRVDATGSSFKNSLTQMPNGGTIYAEQISGDFTLDRSKPAVFIAGGIGITPFRSNIEYLIDTNTKHTVDLFYFAKTEADFVFKDVFDKASEKLGIKTHYIVSDNNTDLEKLIKDNVTDYKNRKYYLSGPNAMVDSYKKIIRKLGVERNHIITDYFPGY